jgi:hypothetical protein
MLLVNPFTGKPVDASDDESVSQLLRAGFKEKEPEAVAPVDSVAAPSPRKRGRPPKTTS